MMIFTYVIAQCQLLAAVQLAFVYYLYHRAKFTPEVIKKNVLLKFFKGFWLPLANSEVAVSQIFLYISGLWGHGLLLIENQTPR